MPAYLVIVLLSWAAFVLVWMGGAFAVKRDVNAGRGFWAGVSPAFLARLALASIAVFAVTRATGAIMRASHRGEAPHGLFAVPIALAWSGAALTVLGVLFAIWARMHLGRNWSSQPAMKEEHQLVTSGPYRFVRHPIYTGIIVATLGSALTGSIVAGVSFVIVSVTFAMRVSREERIMHALFPVHYEAYARGTSRLFPLIW